MNRWLVVIVLVIGSVVFLPAARAVSPDARELMALREKHAAAQCELTKLYRQREKARKSGNETRARELNARMQALDRSITPDMARMMVLRQRVRGTSDYPAILQQQVTLDKACQSSSRNP